MEVLIVLAISFIIIKVAKTSFDKKLEEQKRLKQEEAKKAREELEAQRKKEKLQREAAHREQMRIKQEQQLLQLAEERRLAESLEAEKKAQALKEERVKKQKVEEERQRIEHKKLLREQERIAEEHRKEQERIAEEQRKKAKLEEWKSLEPLLEQCFAFKELTKSLNLLLKICNKINDEFLLCNYNSFQVQKSKHKRIQFFKEHSLNQILGSHLNKDEFLLLPESSDYAECYRLEIDVPRQYSVYAEAPKSKEFWRHDSYISHPSYASHGFLLSDGFHTLSSIKVVDPLVTLPNPAVAPPTLQSLDKNVAKQTHKKVQRDIHRRSYRNNEDWPELINSISDVEKYETARQKLESTRDSLAAKAKSETDHLKSIMKNAHDGSAQAITQLLDKLNQRDRLQHLILNVETAISMDDKLCVCEFEFDPPSRYKLVEKLFKNGNTKLLTEKEQKKYIDQTLTSLMIRTAYVIAHEFKDLFETLVVNANHTWDDPATGKTKNGCIATLQATTEALLDLVPEKVDPELCFRSLKGLRIPQLEKPATVTPSFELDKDDPRVIKGKDVLPNLDPAMNLAAMDWMDFEYLVKQLIESFYSDKAEAQSFQASRDRGVDAVILDPHPITGGKTVIQAKRYANTVDAAAVRDLYGTVTHEGANSGLLITTSKFGSDAREWAKGKPLKLIDGVMLLSLLLEQTGVTYRIDLDEAKALSQDAN